MLLLDGQNHIEVSAADCMDFFELTNAQEAIVRYHLYEDLVDEEGDSRVVHMCNGCAHADTPPKLTLASGGYGRVPRSCKDLPDELSELEMPLFSDVQV